MTPQDRRAARDEIRHILIGVAKLQTTISYGELTNRLTSVTLHVRAPQFYEILRDICRAEDAAGRGFLCALVVRQSDGRPGQGFFKMLAQQRQCDDLESCWQREIAYLYDVWGTD